MGKIYTNYGIVKGITSLNFYLGGELESCMLTEKNTIELLGTELTPIYDYNNRRKEIPALSFYEEGDIKSISLQNSTTLNTDAGSFTVEKINFYKGNKLKALFLLDGKLTGYWTQDDEYKLANNHLFNFSFGAFVAKIISINFYEDGKTKSLTLWPQEKVQINTPVGVFKGRIGISLYESGKLKSFEPKIAAKVHSVIGEIEAYDTNAIGINGNNNSLEFYEDGNIKSLTTSTNIIKVFNREDTLVKEYKPIKSKSHIIGEWEELKTIKLEFFAEEVSINSETYELNKYKFEIEKLENRGISLASNCSKCMK